MHIGLLSLVYGRAFHTLFHALAAHCPSRYNIGAHVLHANSRTWCTLAFTPPSPFNRGAHVLLAISHTCCTYVFSASALGARLDRYSTHLLHTVHLGSTSRRTSCMLFHALAAHRPYRAAVNKIYILLSKDSKNTISSNLEVGLGRAECMLTFFTVQCNVV